MLQGSLIAALVVAVFACLLAMMFFWRQAGWFVQWLKGSVGFCLLFFAVVLAFSISDILSYQSSAVGKVIANVSIYQLGDQSFDVTVTDAQGNEHRSMVRGDQWQLDVRLLRWHGPVMGFPQNILYRLERMSGRYLRLEQERTQERTTSDIKHSRWIDVWQTLHAFPSWLTAEQGRAQYMPLVNGAVFAIHADVQGVATHPVNDVAEQALQRGW